MECNLFHMCLIVLHSFRYYNLTSNFIFHNLRQKAQPLIKNNINPKPLQTLSKSYNNVRKPTTS